LTHHLASDAAEKDDFNQSNNGGNSILVNDVEGGEGAVAKGLVR
jgi:hypothetical protein